MSDATIDSFAVIITDALTVCAFCMAVFLVICWVARIVERVRS